MPTSLFKKLSKTPLHALWYFLLVIVLPASTLAIGGLVYFWQHNLLLIIVAGWLIVSALSYAVFIYWPSVKAAQSIDSTQTHTDENARAQTDESLPSRLAPQSYWSTHDNEVWERCCQALDKQLDQQLHWQAIPDMALAQLTLVSEEYHGASNSATLQFTVPELLLVISVASDRYRQLVIKYVPYIDKISIAKANTLVKNKDSIKTGYQWFNRIRRTVRLANPVSAAMSELRDLVTNQVFSKASSAIQTDMKRLLLQEVTQVGIDLYSGKLNTSEQELASYQSRSSHKDEHRQFEAAEPLRIVLLGQSSTGKSSLINVLTQAMQAEVGVGPVTDSITVHEFKLADTTVVHLIDTPGIDGSDNNMTLLLEQALEADLIIWLTKATQPARAPDHALYAQLQTTWTQQRSRLQAPMIMALTHIDQLSPKSIWQPPFDLSSDDPKAKSILSATESARTHIGFTDSVLTIALYLGDQYEHYNADALASQIMMLTDKSHHVQRNRRRIELGANAPNWHARWMQAKRLGTVIGQSVVKQR